MSTTEQTILFGILFTVCAFALWQTREIWKLDHKLIAAEELAREDAERLANLTVALEDATARAEGSEAERDAFREHAGRIWTRVLEARAERDAARTERDDALGKLGALGALVRDAARNGRELN